MGLANLPKVRTEYCRKAVPLGRGSKKIITKMAQTKKAVCLLTDSFNALYEPGVIEATASYRGTRISGLFVASKCIW